MKIRLGDRITTVDGSIGVVSKIKPSYFCIRIEESQDEDYPPDTYSYMLNGWYDDGRAEDDEEEHPMDVWKIKRGKLKLPDWF